MTKSFTRIRAALLAASFVIGMAAPRAHAGIAVSPLKQEITAHPGEPGKYTLTIANNSRGPQDITQGVRLSVVDVQVSEQGAIIFKDPGTAAHSAGKWVTLSTTDLTLDPKTSQAVEFTITPPQSALPGEYYAAIMVTLKTLGHDAKGVTIQYRTASGIFVTIPGRTFPKQARITRCEMIWPSLASAGQEQPADTQPPKLSLTVQNFGQARFDATGKMALYDEKSRLVFAGPLYAKRACVFGGDTRVLETALNKPIPTGKYTAKVTLDYQSWGPLHQTLPVEILPNQAQFLTLLKKRQLNDSTGLEAAPEKIALTIPPGGSRHIALAVKNIVDVPVQCNTAVFPSEDAAVDDWIAIATPDCTITKAARKSIPLSIAIPKGTKPGRYSSTISLQGTPEGTDPAMLLVPVEIEVKAER